MEKWFEFSAYNLEDTCWFGTYDEAAAYCDILEHKHNVTFVFHEVNNPYELALLDEEYKDTDRLDRAIRSGGCPI